MERRGKGAQSKDIAVSQCGYGWSTLRYSVDGVAVA